jgi:hypothetical protein
MNEFILKIYPSDAPHDEKERRFREALELLLHPTKGEKGEKRETAGKITETKSDSQNIGKPAY